VPSSARVGDATGHGAPLTGSGSPNVLVGNMPAWRALPPPVGAALEEASTAVKEITAQLAPFMPADVLPKLPDIQAKLVKTGTTAAEHGNGSAPGGVSAAFASFMPLVPLMVTAYTTSAAIPLGEPGARMLFTQSFKHALAQAAGAAVTAIAGAWDMHTCPTAAPAPHGPGMVTVGSSTVLINDLPAARQNDKVFEAAGGPDPISVGCPTVEIG